MVLLLARTHYSLLTAPASPQQLCEEAVRAGLSHLVLADSNGLYGLWPFAQQAARVGLRALFGCELVHRGRRVVAIARDRVGYASLCALLSERGGAGAAAGCHGVAAFDLVRACERHAAGLWFLCGDPRLLPSLSAYVPRAQLLVMLPGLARGVPLADPCLPWDAAAEIEEPNTGRKLPDPGPCWPRSLLVALAADLDLRLCATHDVWFAEAKDHALHQLFLAVKWNRGARVGGDGRCTFDLRGIGLAPTNAHLPQAAAVDADHRDFPDALAAAEEVLASCTLAFAERAAPIFPPIDLPAGVSAMQQLRGLVRAGLRRRYGEHDAARARGEHELAVIERMGFAPYFLAVHAIAELARARDIPCLGRGSAADSLVAYCLGLTDADPLRYGLLFERFLNPGRSDLPDIDLDFCWRRRDELVDAVYAHFGPEHVARIATFVTTGARAAYQEAAKVLGMPVAEAARRSKLLPWHADADTDLAAVVAATPGFFRRGPGRTGTEASGVLPPAAEQFVLAAAGHLLAAPRHLGVHPGGVVITPEPIRTHAPLERAAKGVVVTQYDMHFVEGLGMVKIDLLGNRALTIVRDCTAALHRLGLAVPDLEQVAEDDPRTAALLQNGGTLGCFQVESPAMRTLLQQMGAGTMDRVIQAIALVRPGPASSGMKDAFVRRARGLEPPTAPHPLLVEVFADTFGIMLYQEDVIRAAMAVAGVDATAGDGLRRQLGKRRAAAGEFDGFLVAGLRRGLPRLAIEQIWAEMERFAGYSFCKAHAVSYGRLAYRCVWLKARWPAAFLAALLRNDAGYFAPGVYAEEAKRLGASLRAPCVQHGGAEHELLDVHTIRIGLSHVRGLSVRTVQAILQARAAGGPFRSFGDFLQRVAPARHEAEHLIQVGACDLLLASRPELLWRLQVASTPQGQRAAAKVAAAARDVLFADAAAPRDVVFPTLPDFDDKQVVQAELRLLGFTLGSHPVDVLWRRGELPARAGCVPCGDIGAHGGETVSVCGFAVAFRGHRSEQGGMCFVTVEDGTGIVEATLFAKVHERLGGVLQGRGPYVVKGVVEERLGGGVGLRVVDVRAV
ncbi:MAG: DNA polymerase III subunit alpha [Planctomycetes bacterium]|nr:DNA polymerase III subunit alpha [Planctomycetota bacterium]